MGTDKIGKISPQNGEITEYDIPTQNASPDAIAAGPDNNIWFTEAGQTKSAKFHPKTVKLPSMISRLKMQPGRHCGRPDNNMWFTESGQTKSAKFHPKTVKLPSMISNSKYQSGRHCGGPTIIYGSLKAGRQNRQNFTPKW